MSVNTISNELILEFDKYDHKDALIKITAPSQADIKAINGILYTSFSYMNDKKRYSWEFEEGWDDGIDYVYNKTRQTIPIGLNTKSYTLFKRKSSKFKDWCK